MRQFLYLAFIAIVMAGCSDNSASTGSDSRTSKPVNEVQSNESAAGEGGDDADFYLTGDVNVDTLGMAEFLAIKKARIAQYNQSKSGQTTASGKTINKYIKVDTTGFAEYKRSKAATASLGQDESRSQFKTEADAKAYADSLRREAIIEKNKKVYTSAKSGTAKTGTAKTGTASKQGTTKNSNTSTSTSTDQTKDVAQQTPPKAVKKKSTSNRVKGAVIGGVTGAAAGAVINKKNRTKGGIIGGILGAGAGYGIGRSKDKKDTVANEVIKDTTNNKQ